MREIFVADILLLFVDPQVGGSLSIHAHKAVEAEGTVREPGIGIGAAPVGIRPVGTHGGQQGGQKQQNGNERGEERVVQPGKGGGAGNGGSKQADGQENAAQNPQERGDGILKQAPDTAHTQEDHWVL